MRKMKVRVEFEIEVDDRTIETFRMTDALLADRVRVGFTSELLDMIDGRSEVWLGKVDVMVDGEVASNG